MIYSINISSSTNSDKVLCCVIVGHILEIQWVVEFKQRMVHTKVNVGPVSDGVS